MLGIKVNERRYDKIEELGEAYYLEQKSIAALPKAAQVEKEIGDLGAPTHESGVDSPFTLRRDLEVEQLPDEKGPPEPQREDQDTGQPPEKKDEAPVKAARAENDGFTFPDEVILFGKPVQRGPILDQLCNNIGTLPRRLSPNYPGRGRGVIQYVWSPLRYRSNATIVYGGDDEGLDKAVDALIGLLREQPERLQPPPPHKGPPLTSDGSEHGQEPVTIFPDSFGACLHQVAFSADGKYLVASAKEWSNNVFFFSSDGRLLWKAMAGKCYSSIIGIAEDGGRVAIAAAYPDNANSYAILYDRTGRALKKYANYGLRWQHSPSFCLTGDGTRLLVGGCYGMVAWDEKDRPLWHEDFWRDYRSREDLESKKAVKLALSGDGKHLAIAEYRSPQSESKPVRTTVRMTDPETCKILWSYTFPPLRRAAPGWLLCSQDGSRIVVSVGGLTFIEKGRQVFTYGPKTSPNVVRSVQMDRDGERVLIGEYGGAACLLSHTGELLWRFMADGDVQCARLSPDGEHVVLSTNRGGLYMLDASGRQVWKSQLGSESVAEFHPGGQSFVTADHLGRIKSFDLDGREHWEVNVNPEVYREDLYTKIYAERGDDIPVVAYRPEPPAMPPVPETRNLALEPGTKIAAWSPSGWAYQGGLTFQHDLLINGKLDDLERPWYEVAQLCGAGMPYAQITLPKLRKIDTLVTWNHTGHPECQVKEALVEAWVDDAWKPVAQGFYLEGNVHVFHFDPPVNTDKVLYSAFTNLRNNIWISEIGLYGPE
jgi:outer membrane protein assembly factor BamB